MKWCLAILAMVVLAGCASSVNTPAADSGSAPAAAGGDQSSSDQAGAVNTIAAPPVGALYSLRCAVYTDPDHVAQASRMKELLIDQTKSNLWYVVHRSDESDLFYGYYKTFDDRTQVAEYTRAQSDRGKVAAMVDNTGEPLFPYVTFCSIDVPDPPAPKEWDLSSNTGFWTLQIAVYKGSPERKQMAVDAVRQFRAHGVEAYYRHGDSTSEVYIGSWPREAVQEQEATDAQSDDPNQPLLVVPGPLPQGVDSDKVYDQSGRKMKVVMPKLVILDPSLKAATEQYPNYYVNGEVIGHKVQLKDGSVQTVPWPSYLIQVPHENDDQNPDKTDVGNSGGTSDGGDSGSNSAPSVPGLNGLGQ